MISVFICYRRADTSPYAGRLYDALARKLGRDNVFMDVEILRPGQDWVEAIEEQVGRCDVLLALIGPAWLQAADRRGVPRIGGEMDRVRLEIEAALRRGKVVIPVLFEETPMPQPEDLPESLRPLIRRHAVRISHVSFSGDLAALVREIRALQKEKSPATSREGARGQSATQAKQMAVAGTAVARRDLPTGTVTFLFSDVEGSTRLLHELGAERYAAALAEHRRVLREAFASHGGVEVDAQGDAFFIAFPTASGALQAARQAQAALAEGPIRVRMGIHSGTPVLNWEGYVGADVHRVARIAAAGHGGQVLVSAATAGLVPHDGLVDLSEHRLKDLSAPERIYQLGAGEFPPLKTLYQTNLPVPMTTFLGRASELAELDALLCRDEIRLVTLTGPGGTGKTRLALQAAAAACDRFPDGVWWVPLAPVRDPALVLPTIGGILGASGDLAAHIADKRIMLVLDNLEQVVDAAGEVGQLLASCPNLHVVVTSRELLQLPGEHAYPVPPLRPDEGEALFVTRARQINPSFAGDGAISTLCTRLDNLPLAIELAAARVRMLSPEQLLARLGQRLDLLKGGRGVDARQETLRATIDWSYELLSADEQHLFARLSVFRGGWTLEAAEAVAGADVETLQSLVDKSLVRVRDERFSMLETLREYAAERLEASAEADLVARRHAEYFLVLAEDAYPHLTGNPKLWLDRLEREHDNLRAALDRLHAKGDSRREIELAGALWKFWSLRGHWTEGRQRLQAALAVDSRPISARARALIGLIGMGEFQDRSHGEEALAIYRDLGDEAGVANAMFIIAVAGNHEFEFAAARPLLEQCLPLFRKLADDHYELLTMFHLAWALRELGEVGRARELNEALLQRARELGNRRMEAMALDAIGEWQLEQGLHQQSLESLREALRVYREIGVPDRVLDTLVLIASCYAATGEVELSVRLVVAAAALQEESRIPALRYAVRRRQQLVAYLERRLGRTVFDQLAKRGAKLTLDDATQLAIAGTSNTSRRRQRPPKALVSPQPPGRSA